MLEQNPPQTLINPIALRLELPVSDFLQKKILNTRHTARKIIHGQDDRLLVIVGPCSIHDVDAALEFALLLNKAQRNFVDELFIVMRVYFEKARTTTGWKGLIHDPDLDGSSNINRGLKIARKLLINLTENNVPAATEFLNPHIPLYLSDLITWSAIGARTSESQLHRELASGLPMPVGFKNNTDGNVQIAMDAAYTASQSHHFLSINQQGVVTVQHTPGNSDCHIILRGSDHSPNYSAQHVIKTHQALKKNNLIPHLIVDCSHGNSSKHCDNQITAAKSVIEQIKQPSNAICGVMIESNLVAGHQLLGNKNNLVYGQSITDQCLSWDDTLLLLNEFATAVRIRRTKNEKE